MGSQHDRCSPEDHPVVMRYRQRYVEMATSEYRLKLVDFTKSVLEDSIEGLDWKQLLEWEHRHLEYTKDELPKQRAELPTDIVLQIKGRCGEFALLYTGLLLANGYKVRLVLDCSSLRNKSKKVAGDHVWVEVFVNNAWVHVDPTEKRVNQPLMYVLEWDKDVNLVYALTVEEIVNVTKTYRS